MHSPASLTDHSFLSLELMDTCTGEGADLPVPSGWTQGLFFPHSRAQHILRAPRGKAAA